MTETQAASGAAGASTGADAADGENAGGTPTGRAVVGRAAVPAEPKPAKFTRPAGMPPPPGSLDGQEKRDAGKDSADEPAREPETAPVSAAPVPSKGRAPVAATARVGAPPAGAAAATTTAPTTVTPAATPTTDGKTATRPATAGRAVLGGAKVADAVRAARATVTSAAARGPRRARLFVKRIDPWSVMKFSFAVSFVLFFVAIVATSVLYLALDAMGVFRSLNKALAD